MLLGAEEEKAFAKSGFLQIAIPSYVKHDIVLWNWDMQAGTNGDPQFQQLFDRLKTMLDDYSGPIR